MVGVYVLLGLALLGCGLTLFGIGIGVISPGTGNAEGGDVVMGLVMALIGLFILGLGIGQARPSEPPVVADAEGVHVQGTGASVVDGRASTPWARSGLRGSRCPSTSP